MSQKPAGAPVRSTASRSKSAADQRVGRAGKPASNPAAPLGLFRAPGAGEPAPQLSVQSVALAEMHHELLFCVSTPHGRILDANPLALRRLAADRETLLGRTLADALGAADAAGYLSALPSGRPVRWTQRLTLGLDSEPILWEFRALQPAGITDGTALVSLRLMEDRRNPATPNAAAPLQSLPDAAMRSAESGAPQPLLEWLAAVPQTAYAALYYTHRESGLLRLAYDVRLPRGIPHDLPHSIAGKEPAPLSAEALRAAGMAAGAATDPVPVGCPLQAGSLSGWLLVGWREADTALCTSLLMPVFSAAHASLLRELLAREQQGSNDHLAVRASAALRALMDELPQALVLVRAADGHVLEASLSCEGMFGFSSAVLASMRLEDWLSAPEAAVSVRAACENGRISESGELTLYRRDGEGFPAVVRALPLREGARGEYRDVLVIITDLTSSRDARVESRHLQRQAVLGWMAASFAHEIRNPLNNLSLQLEEMRALHKLEPDVETLALESQEECRRLTEISRRMLDFARGQDFRMAPTDMVALVKRVLQRMQPSLERTGVRTLLSAPDGLPAAMADSLSIEQVILNLIDNAAKAMPDGGHLGVSLESSALESGAPAVEIRVADTGRGLPAAVREKLFQPYVTTRSDGHGLGLALSRHIMDAHRGALRAESYPGSGTVFRVFLPIATENA